jgi:glycosyltransferase involved in cell wall biosynthesis
MMGQDQPHIAILMASYNGARFIEGQLQSILDQDHENWSLWISDDGSTDGTIELIEAFCKAHPEARIHLREGPKRGAAQNFLSLVTAEDIEADYWSFADQDDVWFPNKLSRALQVLPPADATTPFLYGARTAVTDMQLNQIGQSVLHGRGLGFQNALVQNFAAGNTMVFTHAARALFPKSAAKQEIVALDWMTYQLVAGAGGDVFFDHQPCLYYRQHDQNEIGYNFGVLAKFKRAVAVMNGRFGTWNRGNLAVLKDAHVPLTSENKAVLAAFEAAMASGGIKSALKLKQSGCHRQSALGTAALYVAAALGRI